MKKAKLAAIILTIGLTGLSFAQEEEKQATEPALNIDTTFIEVTGDSGSVVKLFYNGEIEYGEDYEPTEAAKFFFEELSKLLKDNETSDTATLLRLELLTNRVQLLRNQIRQEWLRLEKEAQ